jgi:Smr domain
LDFERARVRATKLVRWLYSISCLVNDHHLTRETTASGTTIDLHYTTAPQAVILAKEFLRDYDASDSELDRLLISDVGADKRNFNCSPSHAVQFITGQGKHSVDGKAVLRPAVYDALVKDGWDVSTFAGGLVVRGRLRS